KAFRISALNPRTNTTENVVFVGIRPSSPILCGGLTREPLTKDQHFGTDRGCALAQIDNGLIHADSANHRYPLKATIIALDRHLSTLNVARYSISKPQRNQSHPAG